MAERTPTEPETKAEKNRLIKLVQPKLREHGLVDLTDFVSKNGGDGFRHPGFVRSVAYRMEEMGLVEVIPRKEWTEFYIKRAPWSKRNPYLHAFKLGAIGVVFSILAGISLAVTQFWIKNKYDRVNAKSTQPDSLSFQIQKERPTVDSTKEVK